MDIFIIPGLLVVYFICLIIVSNRNNKHQQEIKKLQDYQAIAAQAASNTIENNISSAIKGAIESTRAELISSHKTLITKTAEAHKKEMQNRIVKLSGEVIAFEQHTKEYFKENLDDHLTKAESRIGALEKKKDELETYINSELSDLREFEIRIITSVNQRGIIFNKIPNGDDTFDFYVCERIGTTHLVPKTFDHWKAQPETVQVDRMRGAVYIKEGSNEKIKIPIPLLTQIQNPEPRQERKEISNIPISDQETFDPLICPVCDKPFTDPLYTRQHIDQKQDQEHINYRRDYPGYADYLTAAIQEESQAPLPLG